MAATGGFFRGGRFKELVKKYGKVALGVHFSISAASITGLYVAIKNNIDVESVLEKWHLPGVATRDDSKTPIQEVEVPYSDEFIMEGDHSSKVAGEEEKNRRNRTAELAASAGGALTLAVLCNKALFPVRVPITIALTPPIARFLARRKLIKNSSL
uniref:Uncharacterized protein MANES_11G097000 n=1 Tax=Rhizophora mucronata TaxID=61149 RepID=A0A2P2IZ63_RHIMU